MYSLKGICYGESQIQIRQKLMQGIFIFEQASINAYVMLLVLTRGIAMS